MPKRGKINLVACEPCRRRKVKVNYIPWCCRLYKLMNLSVMAADPNVELVRDSEESATTLLNLA